MIYSLNILSSHQKVQNDSLIQNIPGDQASRTEPKGFLRSNKRVLDKLNSLQLYLQNSRQIPRETAHNISTLSSNANPQQKSEISNQDHLLIRNKSLESSQAMDQDVDNLVCIEDETEKPKPKYKNGSRKKKHFWTPQEDQTLVELMKTYGEKWTKMGRILGGRSGKQVRDRYLNYLKPSIRQKAWSNEEEELLGKLYQEFGNKWSTIALYLPGRTENQVKNKFYSRFRKGETNLGQAKEDQLHQPLIFVKMDPSFEEGTDSGIKSEEGQNNDCTPTLKKEFETYDGISQSTHQGDQTAEQLIGSLQSKRAGSFLSDQSIKEEPTLNVKYEEESDPYKKIKCESLENDKTVVVKQEAW